LARGVFQRLAQAGDSRAAFLLAETYDPISLAKRQLLPPESDPELARIWYRKASEGGSPEANARLDRLSNW
jgi:TPR repeat protein